jgi:hypothetical protein
LCGFGQVELLDACSPSSGKWGIVNLSYVVLRRGFVKYFQKDLKVQGLSENVS